MPSKPRQVTVRGKRRWRIEICVESIRESKTLDTKNEALTWAVEREAMLRGRGHIIQGKTMADAFKRFSVEVSPRRGYTKSEQTKLLKLLKDPIARVPVFDLSVVHGRDYINRELGRGLKNNSVLRGITFLSVIVRQCIEWQWIPEYPWTGLKLPKPNKPRTRLPAEWEITAITNMAMLKTPCTTKTQISVLLWLISLETAMRQGEMCKLSPEDIDLEKRTVFLKDTKNGDDRIVPLSTRAVELMQMVKPASGSSYFGISNTTCAVLFIRVMNDAGVEGLNFHDARAYATGKLSKKVDIYTLARITGHRRLESLLIYYREDMSNIAKMLD